jgi:iron complex outermembrane receptor protein
MKFLKTPIAMTVAMCVTSGAFAQQALDTITVTASPIIESNQVDNFSGFSTQVTDAQIKDLGALDLAAALRMTPGVQISRYNEVGSYSGDQGGNVYIRGLGASRPGSEIKTYLDGVPVYMGLWNHPLIDLLPLNGVKSVDIYKGPQNQVSGNNFASINLQSKRAPQEGTETEVNASLGSFATKILQANMVGRKGDLDYSLAGGQVESNGARANADGKLSNAMGRIAKKIDNAWTVGANFLTVSNKVGDPGDNRYATSTSAVGPYSFSNGVARNESETNLLSAFVNHQHGDWKGEFKVYQNRGHNNLTNDPNWGTFSSYYEMSGFRWKEESSPWKNGKFVGGIDQESVSGSLTGPHVGSAVGTPFAYGTAGSADVPTFRVSSAFAGLSHNFQLSKAWVMQPSVGMRTYSSNIYGSKSAPNAGVSFISDNATVYANYTEGLLYPGAETYTLTRAIPMAFAANNGWNRLSPSQNKHSEVGVKWDASAQTHIDLSIFQDEISNRYVWTGFYVGAGVGNPATAASGTWSNSFPTYRVSGTEVSIKHQFNSQWSVFGGVTALDSSLSNLPYAPKTAVSVGVNGKISEFRVAFDAQHQTGMYSLTQDRGDFNPNEVGSLTVANARISRPMAALGKKGEVYAAVNNLFDVNYQYNAGYPMAGRNFRVGLIARF